MVIDVRVIPNASRTAITGRRGTELVLKVNTPALDGRANRTAILYLARVFDVSPSSVRLVRGERSRHKKFEILGADASAVSGLLSEYGSE